jgi:3-hydroxybutyryl-CoA dehydrogenase
MINNITIVGVGWMGKGIAQVCAHGGYNILLHDIKEEALEQAQEGIRTGLSYMVEKELLSEGDVEPAVSRIRTTTSLEEAVKGADLVIEAVPEMLDLKKEVFNQMDKLCGEQTILASNSSTLSTTAIAEATSRPERVVGMHWFYPAYIMPPVEVIKGARTSEQTANTVRDLCLKLKKMPVVCKEVPGFLINRLQMVLFNEAASLLEQGVASAEDIDNAARMSLGLRLPFWGPLKIEDLVVPKNMLVRGFEYIYQQTGSDRFRPTELIKEKVEKGEIGLIAGKGYYDYTKEPPGAVARERDEMVIKQLKFLAELGYAELP